MIQASVGFQCPECTRTASRRAPVYTSRTLPRTGPILTYVLIAANVVVFLVDIALSSRLSGIDGTPVVGEWVIFGPSVASGEWWRLLTAGFVHFSVLHIGMNMFVLWRIGTQLESILGHLRYATLYVASLCAGSLGAMLLDPGKLTAGASGAIFGLLGAAAAYQLAHRINMWQSGLAMLIGLNLLITFTIPGISIGGHLGGLVAGTACGYAMFQLEQRRVSPWLGVGIAAVLVLACLVAGVLVAPDALRPLR